MNTIRLKYVTSLNMGQSPSSDSVNFEEDGIPFLQGKADFGTISPQPTVWCSAPKKIAEQGDILLSVRAPVGTVNISDQNYAIGRGLCGIRAVKINQRFCWYLLQAVTEQLLSFSTGTTYDAVSVSDIANLVVPYPNEKQQAIIAAYLDRRIAEIDSLLADLQSQVEMLDTYKRELIAEAVTKGLNKSAAMKNSGVDYIGMIPEAWEMLPLFAVAKENSVKNTGLVCENLLSLSYGKIIRKDIDTNFGLLPASFESYQIVQPGCTVLRFTDLQNDKRSLRSGYVTETGIITSAYMVLIPSERLDSKYFSYLLHAYDLMKVYYGMGGGLRQTLRFSDVKRLPVLIPTMSEQKAIVAYVDEKTTKIESLIADITAQIEKLKQYRQIVIHDAVTGKIKVTEG